MDLNELNKQLEKLNNPESSVDEKYKALTWIAENANDVDIAKLIEHGVVQNIHFESAILFNVYHFDYRFYEMVHQLFPTKLKNSDEIDCPELPTEVYINEFKERIVNEMAIFISFGLLEEDDACYDDDDGYC